MSRRRRVPRLVLVTNRKQSHHELPELAQSAIAGGVDLVQIREKDLVSCDLSFLLRSIIERVTDRLLLAVNNAVDLAATYEIGVHLPELSMSSAETRERLGPTTLIGRSVHSVEAIETSHGADYLIAGHVFPSTSKPGQKPIGLDGLRNIVKASSLPVLAVGGVTASNVAEVIATGAYGVAVISAINNACDPQSAASVIRHHLDLALNSSVFAERNGMDVTHTCELQINGKPVTLNTGTTLSQFLKHKGLEERLVVVELNETILPRSDYGSTILTDGDRVEIVHFVGGG